MSFTHSSVVDAPLREVFAWHERPGALTRLAPPWQPVRVVAEAGSLRDGRAVLALPAGLRWVAAHQSTGYDPPYRFVDELASGPVGAVVRWRHTHTFAEAGPGTRVTDLVDTQVPSVALRAMFTYRHAQLADDLAAQARARAWSTGGGEPLTVAVTGASGTVGTALAALLTTGGHRVVRLVRHAARAGDERQWDPNDPAGDLLDGVDAVVHLAGASIAGRFTAARKAAVRDSRIGPTRRLAEVAGQAAENGDGPTVFVSASAIGGYGPDRGEEVVTEDSPRGDGFLAELVADWEAASGPAEAAGIRCVQVRTGIVQTPRGGTLRIFRPLFALGGGGRLGDGRQWLSWIGIDDLVDIYRRALVDTGLSGPVNAVAPNPVRNAEYTRVLARVMRRPALLPAPEFGPRLLLGEEGARELALANQRVHPARLVEAGHEFRYPELEPLLRHLLGRRRDTVGTAAADTAG